MSDYVPLDTSVKPDDLRLHLKQELETNHSSVQKSISGKGRASTVDLNQKGISLYGVTVDYNNTSNVLRAKQQLRDFSENSIVQAIIRTRINQVLKFSRPATYSRTGMGFKIVPKKQAKDGHLTAKQVKQMAELEDFISTLGDDSSYGRKSFPNFLTTIIHDHYVYDQMNAERVFGADKTEVDHFNAVDASTIVYDKVPKNADDPRKFAQFPRNYSDKPVAKFTEKEMAFVTCNSFGDVTRRGYGYSEVEASIIHLKYHNDTEQFNARFFAQGGTTRGLLLINYGDSSYQQTAGALASFRKQWQSSFQGNNGAWKIPVLTGQDAKYVNMTQSSKDME